MDATFECRERVQEEHEIQYEFILMDVAGGEQPPFMQYYQTECEELPTSWTFRMRNQQVMDTGIVSSSVILRRDDSTNKPVHALVLVSSFDTSYIDSIPRCSNVFENDTMSPGDELHGFIPHLAQFPSLKNCVLHKALVVIRIVICDCHQERNEDSITSESDDNSITFPSNI
ncbi:hypothetical protein AVEN_161600-1 [Araneus ventricosus]|uniref:Uncharacterized protein n=1 Tax=Araneus ventricosus TaxID=182803 RepID=A0A4Y2FN03_ARAVE|nr:hypothetical protein AVEN_161600-1 [Araneus ventricosus]